MLPDLDVIGFQFGIAYTDFWGHRGFTHSLLFALLTSIIIVAVAFYEPVYRRKRTWLLAVFFLVTASHGLFDAMTNGGLGIAFFSPFNDTRYFLPFRPIHVSPIGVRDFFNHGGVRVMLSELIWLILPSLGLIVLSQAWRRLRSTRSQ